MSVMSEEILSKCKAGLCSVCSAVTGTQHALHTVASLVSNLSPLAQRKACVSIVSDTSNSPKKQMELRFMRPRASRSAHDLDLGTIRSFSSMRMLTQHF